jgi:hypothetical protein
MSFYEDYNFEVKAVHPSGLLSYQSGRATTQRKFLVACEHAEELALRLLGKFWVPGDTEIARLPAPFPMDYTGASTYGQMGMVAIGFSIEPVTATCFNVLWVADSIDRHDIIDPTSFAQSEAYFYRSAPDDPADEPPEECCMCYVTVAYAENPCDCVVWDDGTKEWTAHSFILPNTCISVERNPSYEMFTLPNGNLVWADLPEGPDRKLKQDSYAYKIIPKADITVSWHNVPLNKLCQIESHLLEFRGHVNRDEWGEQLACDYVSEESEIAGCTFYEPETLLFIGRKTDHSEQMPSEA